MEYDYPDAEDVVVAGIYESQSPRTKELWNQGEYECLARVREVLETLSPRNRLIDFGSGVGRLTLRFVDLFDEGVTSFEPSPSRLMAQQEYLQTDPNCDMVTLVPETAGLRGDYDAAIFSHVVQHILDVDAKEALANVVSLLRPGGVLALFATVTDELDSYFLSFIDEQGVLIEKPISSDEFDAEVIASFHERLPIRFFNPNTLAHMLHEAGCENLEAHVFHGPDGRVGPFDPSRPIGTLEPQIATAIGKARDVMVLATRK